MDSRMHVVPPCHLGVSSWFVAMFVRVSLGGFVRFLGDFYAGFCCARVSEGVGLVRGMVYFYVGFWGWFSACASGFFYSTLGGQVVGQWFVRSSVSNLVFYRFRDTPPVSRVRLCFSLATCGLRG